MKLDTKTLIPVMLAQKSNSIDPSAALLAGMDGVAGYIGLDRFVTAVTDAERQRDKARTDVKTLTETVDIGTRKYLGLDTGAAVQPAQRAEFTSALTATGDDAPAVVIKKGETGPPPGPIIPDKDIDALAEALVDALKDERPALAAMSDFAEAFLKVFSEEFNGEDTASFNDATVEWAGRAAGFLKAAATAHREASPSETDAFVWAEEKVKQ